MAFENLFIRTQRNIGGIQMDAVLREDHSSPARVTTNPVEFGADISDHVIIDPVSIVVRGVVSDSPLGVAALGQLVDSVTGLFGDSTGENVTRSQQAFQLLKQLQKRKEPISVQTKLELYENMIITDVQVSQDKDSSRIVDMTIPMTQVIIVDSEIVDLPKETLKEGKATEQASSNISSGRKEPVVPNEAREKTLLKQGVDIIRGIF